MPRPPAQPLFRPGTASWVPKVVLSEEHRARVLAILGDTRVNRYCEVIGEEKVRLSKVGKASPEREIPTAAELVAGMDFARNLVRDAADGVFRLEAPAQPLGDAFDIKPSLLATQYPPAVAGILRTLRQGLESLDGLTQAEVWCQIYKVKRAAGDASLVGGLSMVLEQLESRRRELATPEERKKTTLRTPKRRDRPNTMLDFIAMLCIEGKVRVTGGVWVGELGWEEHVSAFLELVQIARHYAGHPPAESGNSYGWVKGYLEERRDWLNAYEASLSKERSDTESA